MYRYKIEFVKFVEFEIRLFVASRVGKRVYFVYFGMVYRGDSPRLQIEGRYCGLSGAMQFVAICPERVCHKQGGWSTAWNLHEKYKVSLGCVVWG
jgi:hypothetical protein